ncbi:hypothetical protein J2Z37_002952 [Ammoniphilus resinae]|uniref:Swt1-like HEPN domain-containing protein n=1 Tax=Ammoniphilus resinae TaxID=861532 RepID=A0ABS4GRP6_9BACL|nr:hypothetical protein [Ammoniphilus resinae]
MSTKLNIEKMCQAYRLLYTIETMLREYIDETFTKQHGLYWYHRPSILKINLPNCRYIELIHIIRKFSSLNAAFTDYQLEELTRLNKVRNKVCHMQHISDEEYSLLVSCYLSVLKCCGDRLKMKSTS